MGEDDNIKTYQIPKGNIYYLQEKLQKLNKRAAKLGVEPITFKIVREYVVTGINDKFLKDKYMAFGSIKVPFRKATGDQATILKGIKTFFERLKKTLQDNRDKLTDEDTKLIGHKF